MDKHPLLALLLRMAEREGFKTTVVDYETAYIHRQSGTDLRLTAGNSGYFLHSPRPECLSEAVLAQRIADMAFGYWAGLEVGRASA